MNRPVYFSANFAIKALANLSRADVVIHGEENIPCNPVIFVVNHFTRIETLLIPHYILQATGVPAFSLASHTLFKGGMKKYFDLIGVISTRDPDRDKIIIRGLLTGSEHWIIFPEGRMVKTKKIMGDGTFAISYDGGTHKPHTGAASLTIRAEILRACLLGRQQHEPEAVQQFLTEYEIESIEDIRHKTAAIVPVNLTYYPIRAKENIASQFAARVLKDIPERTMEEIMTEGTMLFSGVDLDIHFGKPLYLKHLFDSNMVQYALDKPFDPDFGHNPGLAEFTRHEANKLMDRYMHAIYEMTTINHEHIFASFLRKYPGRRIREMTMRRKVYLVAQQICDEERMECNLHKSLQEDQIHLLTDDRYDKFSNFLDLALEKRVLERNNGYLVRMRTALDDLLQFHRGRIDNPIEVIANEAQPLIKLQRMICTVAWLPDWIVRLQISRNLYLRERDRYQKEMEQWPAAPASFGGPYLLKALRRKVGVVLVHSYLASPEEVRGLAQYLNGKGFWVYVPRLDGHSTSPEDLARKRYSDWLRTVERAYALMSTLCDRVVVGGISFGGCLALELASRLKQMSGVFALGSPYRLKDYSSSFMPAQDVWNRILLKLRKGNLDDNYFQFAAEFPHVNYERNPILGVREIGSFLSHLQGKLGLVRCPSLIVHADKDPVVDPLGGRKLFEELGAEDKEMLVMNYARHIIIDGKGVKRVYDLIENFIRRVAH